MADQILGNLAEETSPDDGDTLYVVRNSADRRMARGTLVAGLARASRTVAAGPGLAGGGPLTGDVTLNLDLASLPEDTAPAAAANYVAVQGTAGHRRVRLDRLPTALPAIPNGYASIAVAGQATLTASSQADGLTFVAGANLTLSTSPATDTLTLAATGLVPTARAVLAGAGLSGGGALTADRTLSVNVAGQTEDPAPTLANHWLLTHDAAAGTLRRVRASLLGGGTYVLPPATTSTRGGVTVGEGLAVDVNGLLRATYALPAASAATLGGVRVGGGLAIDGSGTLSADPPTASATTAGVVRVGGGLAVDALGTLRADPDPLPPATATTLGGVKVGANLTVAADGTLAATGGTGGTGGTIATQTEAEAGTSNTAYMSPLRTRQAIDAYGEDNRVTGTAGQVVGFSAAGQAEAVPNTRAIMVQVFAEDAAVATGTAIRRFPWPLSLAPTRAEAFVPAAGTTATTVDVVVGTSIFTAPPTVPAGASSAVATAFATALVPRSAVCEVNVTAAGIGARGLWLVITGIEVPA